MVFGLSKNQACPLLLAAGIISLDLSKVSSRSNMLKKLQPLVSCLGRDCKLHWFCSAEKVNSLLTDINYIAYLKEK